MKTKWIARAAACTAATAFLALGSSAVFAADTAQPLQLKEDLMQLHADKQALQRQLNRLDADQARMKADAAEGRMSAESRDAYKVYATEQAIQGEAKAMQADKATSLQMKADKAALQRQIQRLDMAEARLKGDAQSGRMAAQSKDAQQVYRDQQFARGEAAQIAEDRAAVHEDKASVGTSQRM